MFKRMMIKKVIARSGEIGKRYEKNGALVILLKHLLAFSGYCRIRAVVLNFGYAVVLRFFAFYSCFDTSGYDGFS